MLLIIQSPNLQCDTHMMTYLLWEFYSNFNCCVLSNLELCQTMRSCWRHTSQAVRYRSCSKCFLRDKMPFAYLNVIIHYVLGFLNICVYGIYHHNTCEAVWLWELERNSTYTVTFI